MSAIEYALMLTYAGWASSMVKLTSHPYKVYTAVYKLDSHREREIDKDTYT